MDLGKLNVAASSDEGAEMKLKHPVDGSTLKGEDGKPYFIKLAGKYSQVYKKAERAVMDRRISQSAGRRKAKIQAAQIEEEEAESLARCVISWNVMVDGKIPTCNFDEAFAFFMDPRFAFVREQASEFVDDASNFMKTS